MDISRGLTDGQVGTKINVFPKRNLLEPLMDGKLNTIPMTIGRSET